jgi:hypothetical protein
MDGISLHKYCIISYNAALSSDCAPTKKGVARQPVRRPITLRLSGSAAVSRARPRQPFRRILPFGLLISLEYTVHQWVIKTNISAKKPTIDFCAKK